MREQLVFLKLDLHCDGAVVNGHLNNTETAAHYFYNHFDTGAADNFVDDQLVSLQLVDVQREPSAAY